MKVKDEITQIYLSAANRIYIEKLQEALEEAKSKGATEVEIEAYAGYNGEIDDITIIPINLREETREEELDRLIAHERNQLRIRLYNKDHPELSKILAEKYTEYSLMEILERLG